MKFNTFISSVFALLLGCSSLFANEGDEAICDTTTLNEVTVTAIKQGNLRSIPISSTILTVSQLDQPEMLSVKGVSNHVPNFFIPDYGSRMTSSIYVRGIGARIDQPAVGLNVDNVPIFNKDGYDFDLVDIAGVEMLRGPQSTLYGRNTMGGLVNITTLSPMHYQGLRAMFEYGSGNTLRTSASAYLRPATDFALSATIYYTRSDGFFLNSFNNCKTDRENQLSARLKTEWQVTPDLHLLNTASVSRLRQGGYPYRYIPTGEISYNDTCFYRRTLFNDALTLRLNLPSVVISSMTSAQFIDDNMTLDQDFLPLPYFTLTQKRREWVFTQDFVVKNQKGGVWDRLLGIFGFYRNSHMQAPVTFYDEGISSLIEDHRNEANPDYPIRWNSRELLLQSRFSNPGFGVALYHQSTINLGDWHLTAGLRLDFERTNLRFNSNCNSGYEILYTNPMTGTLDTFREVPIIIDDRGYLHRHFLQFLPRISALYDIPSMQGSNVYASVAKGYKAGGFNTQMFSDVLQQRLMGVMGIGTAYNVEEIITYKPEKSWNFEVGTHLQSGDGKLKTDASLFYILCRDQQLTMFPEGTTTGRIMTNAGKTRSFGGELSASYYPIDALSFMAGYGYTNAKFTQFNNGRNNFSGKYVPYAPSHTLFAAAAVTFDLSWSWFRKLDITTDVSAAGPIYWDEGNTRRQNFYAQSGVSVTISNPRYSLQFWGKNITDTHFDTFYFVSMDNEFLQNGKPARFGVTLKINIDNWK